MFNGLYLRQDLLVDDHVRPEAAFEADAVVDQRQINLPGVYDRVPIDD